MSTTRHDTTPGVAILCRLVWPSDRPDIAAIVLVSPATGLDGVSDAETLDSLVDAIKGWKGTVVVVSHNKDFVTRLAPTHTAVVEGGVVKSLDRPPRASDWEHDAEGQGWKGDDAVAAELTPAQKAEQKAKRVAADKLRKKKVNAPTRILKIQGLLEDLEGNLKTLETKLYAEGTDAATVGKIVEDKEATETRVAKLYQEWEELDELLAEE